MRMNPIVFAGPSTAGAPADALDGLTLRPPAACGDVMRAVNEGATSIGFIDGLFETKAAVWHKELLLALSKGVRILGASSMGALRAAEMYPYGMEGVGVIFRLYRMNAVMDDDEVALLHGPADAGSIPVTEAMINVRATLRRARRLHAIDLATECELAGIAKRIFYKDRTWDRILEATVSRPGSNPQIKAFRDGLRRFRRDLKHEDALLLLRRMRLVHGDKLTMTPPEFSNTTFWRHFESKELQPKRPAAPRGA
jgi:hypothetical protein